MKSILFWEDWKPPFKWLYRILFSLFLAMAIFMLIAYQLGTGWVINWGIVDIKEGISIPLDTFSKGLFSFTTFTDNYIISQRFIGNELEINTISSYLFLGLTGIFLAISLAIVTTLKRFWYITGMVVFIAFITGFKLEHLLLFGKTDKTALILTFALFLPSSYYLHAFKTSASLLFRILFFLGILMIFSLIVFQFSEVTNPFLHLATFGVFGPFLLTIVFIMMISHELVNSFLYAITFSNSASSKYSLRHFTLITGFYLMNLIFLWMHEVEMIDWDIIYFDPFLLLFVSSIVAIWGFIRRHDIIENIISFKVAAIQFVMLAILSLGTISFLFATANDPFVKVIRDTIIYSHLGFGLIFFIYLISNFITPLNNNLQVYKIVYKPQTMPYFTFRLAGLIAVLAMVFKENIEVPVYHSLSGYYNGIADLYVVNKDFVAAEGYYKLGSNYGYQNHRSNYALATLAQDRGDEIAAILSYQRSISKRPTEYAFVNLSNLYLDVDRYFDAMFNLENAKFYFPKSGPILNNLALLYGKTNVIDSVFYYLDQAIQNDGGERNASVNLLSMMAKNEININPDSLGIDLSKLEYLPMEINLSALANQFGNTYYFETPRDSVLNLRTSAYIVNYGYTRIGKNDTLFINYLKKIGSKMSNTRYVESIDLIRANLLYRENRIIEAFQILSSIANNNISRPGYYYNLMGLWALQNNAFPIAERSFLQGIEKGFIESALNLTITYLEHGKSEEALESLENLSGIEEYSQSVTMIAEIIKKNEIPEKMTDIERYQLIRYRRDLISDENLDGLINQFEADEFRIKAQIDLGFKAMTDEEFSISQKMIERLELEKDLGTSQKEFMILKLRHLLATDQLDLFRQLMEAQTIEGSDLESEFIRARYQELTNQDEEAVKTYHQLAISNPFFEEAIIESARFFREKMDNQELAYETLVNAIYLNEESSKLLMEYILQSKRIGYESYAKEGIITLEKMVGRDDYNNFLKEYEKTPLPAENWEI